MTAKPKARKIGQLTGNMDLYVAENTTYGMSHEAEECVQEHVDVQNLSTDILNAAPYLYSEEAQGWLVRVVRYPRKGV